MIPGCVSVCPARGGKGGVEGAVEDCCEFARGAPKAKLPKLILRSLDL